ncbi:hypothetical protein D3C71_1186300 [compost metagenome]
MKRFLPVLSDKNIPFPSLLLLTSSITPKIFAFLLIASLSNSTTITAAVSEIANPLLFLENGIPYVPTSSPKDTALILRIDVTILSPNEESEPPTIHVLTIPLRRYNTASCNDSREALHPQVEVLDIPFNLKCPDIEAAKP